MATASSVSELAREEAERAEAEPDTPTTPDTDDPGTPDTSAPDVPAPPDTSAPEPSGQPQPLNESQIDALWKSLGREDERHLKEVAKRAGPMMGDLERCPLCTDVSGFIFPQLPEPQAGERIARVFAALGLDTGEQYDPAEDKQTCEKCHGWGMTKTGSKVPAQQALPCAACNGNGWTAKLVQHVPAPPPSYMPVPNLVAPPQPNGIGPLDPWQRPIGHPDYGRNPAEVNA